MPGWQTGRARVRSVRLAMWGALIAVVAGGLSPGYGGAPAACRPTIPLSLFGVHFDVVAEPSCGLGMSQASLATAHAGPFALTLCLGVVGMALLSLGGITGVGVALHGLLRRVRDWFTRHTSGTRRPTANATVQLRAVAGTFRLPDLRSAIVARPSRRRGPPTLLPC